MMGQTSTTLNYHRRRETKRLYVQRVKPDTPCADCHQHFHFSAMDFDHIRGEKRYTIGVLVASNLSLSYLLEEIAKCEVVCSNCHRIRTFARKVWMKREKHPERIRNTNERSDVKELEQLLRAGKFDVSGVVNHAAYTDSPSDEDVACRDSSSRRKEHNKEIPKMGVDTTT